MVRTTSVMPDLGTIAPHFDLPSCTGGRVSLNDFAGSSGLLVMFICNHCPFVVHLKQALADFGRDYDGRISIVAIASNNTETHPDDGPEHMAVDAAANGYVFPYLFDETQEVAKAYEAVCTPDFFLYDRERRLVYRGQFDDSRPNDGRPITGADLRNACDALLEGAPIDSNQVPSMGCNIKWKPGNQPD